MTPVIDLVAEPDSGLWPGPLDLALSLSGRSIFIRPCCLHTVVI